MRRAASRLALTEVTIGLIEGKNLRETYATGDGREDFRLRDCRRGDTSCRRNGAGMWRRVTKVTVNDYWAAIVVGPGLKSEDLRFAMSAGASIAGHVFDERGDPVRDGDGCCFCRKFRAADDGRLTRNESDGAERSGRVPVRPSGGGCSTWWR